MFNHQVCLLVLPSFIILDSLTEVELSNIAKELLPLTTDEVIEFAQALQFSKPEIERVMKKSSDTYGRLLSLLRGFKKRTPATQYGTRRCLAKALMEWGHNISLALHLYPKRKTMRMFCMQSYNILVIKSSRMSWFCLTVEIC